MLSPAPNRILIIPLRFIGDTVVSVPLIRNLRRLFPKARIDLLASPLTAPLMQPCPYLDHVLIEPKSALARLKLLRENRYDAVFSMRKSVSMALLGKLAGARHVVGYDKQRFPFGYKRWGWFVDYRARYPSLKTDTPQAVSHLGLLTTCGLPVQDDDLELWQTEEDVQKLEALLETHGVGTDRPLAVWHAASASHGKQIEPQKFAESLQHLHAAGYRILTTGTAADAPMYETIADQLGLPLVNLAGKTSLRETVTLYRRIQLLLTVDSGPIHLGAAAGVPKIVGVFGPTNERQWGPHNRAVDFRPVFLDLPCRPCYAKICEHNNCRVQLTGTHIAEAVAALAPADQPAR